MDQVSGGGTITGSAAIGEFQSSMATEAAAEAEAQHALRERQAGNSYPGMVDFNKLAAAGISRSDFSASVDHLTPYWSVVG